MQLPSLIFFCYISFKFFSFCFHNNFLYVNKSKTTALLLFFFSFSYSRTAEIIKLLLECDLITSVLVKWSNYFVYLSFDLNSYIFNNSVFGFYPCFKN